MERVSASIVECVLLWSASSCIRASCVVSWLTRCCLAGGRSRAARPSRQTDIQSTAMEMDTTPANGSSRARRPRHTAMRAPPSTNSPATEHAATATAMEDVVATPVIAVAALLSTPTIVSPTRSLISPHTLKSGGRQHSHVQKFSCDGCAAARKGGCNKRTSGCERCKENGIECTYVRDGSATSNGTKRSRGGEESSEEQKSSGSTQSTADSASPKRQRKSPRIARGGSPSLDATPASGTSTAASTEESKSQMDFFTPTPLSSSTVVSTRQSLANGGRSPVSSLLSTPASPSPHEPAAKLRQSPVVKQLILSPKLHGAAAAAATQNGDAAEIVRRTSSVADNALTPRLPTEDIEPTPAASSIESTPSGSTPSGSTPSGSTPAPSQSKAASSEDADGDVQMQSASTDSSDDESYDPEMESLSSLSTRSSPASTASAAPSLERTFSSAATPVQLSQEDEVELAAVASTPPPSSSSSKHSAFSPPSMASPKIEPFPPTPEDTVTVNLAAEVKLQPRMLAGGRPTRSGSTASKEKMVSPTLSPVKLRRADATAHAPTAVRTSPIRPAKNKAAAAAAASLAVPVHQPPTRSLASSSAASSSGTGASSQAMLGDVLTGAAIMEDPASTFRVEAAAATCCGFFRKVNQDSFVCRMLSPVAGQAPILCMAVFDGHGILGHLAAASCRRALPVVLYDLIGKGCDLQTALKETIAQLHEALNEDARMIRATVHSSLALQSSQGGAAAASFSSTANTTLAEPLSRRSHSRSGSSTPTSPSKVPTGGLFGNDYGTTAIVVLVQDTTVWIANVGDSRCVMMQREAKHGDSPSISSTATTPPSQPEDWMIVHESLEDNCDSESERKRVQQDGGALFHTGTEYRVYPASMDFQAARSQQLTLNMSRSLGHIKLGQHGISPEPSFHTMQLSRHTDTIIVIGSDGLFDVMASPAIRAIVARDSTSPAEAVRELLETSDIRWQAKKHGDNVTTVVARVTAPQ